MSGACKAGGAWHGKGTPQAPSDHGGCEQQAAPPPPPPWEGLALDCRSAHRPPAPSERPDHERPAVPGAAAQGEPAARGGFASGGHSRVHVPLWLAPRGAGGGGGAVSRR